MPTPPFDPKLVDASVTPEELELATAAPASAFPIVDTQDDVDGDLTDEARGLVPIIPATPHEAILNGRDLRDRHINVGVGRCLATVRGPIFRLPALWPTAEEAAQHGAPIHHEKSLLDIPRGSVIGYQNSHVWHVSLGLGGGLTSTTDYHELGFEGVATIANTAEWCGATDVFWYETLNGFDVWPTPVKPKPHPKSFTREERIAILRNRMRELNKAGHEKRAARFKLWIAQLEAQK